MHGPSPLIHLPHELLLHQLTFFPDILSHLTFSITCRRVQGLYDQGLWRRIALSSGLGKPLDIACSSLSWRQVCMTAVVHAKLCSLPDCSEANLSRGRHQGLLAAPCTLLLSANDVHVQAIDLQLSPVFEGLVGNLEDFLSASIPCHLKPKLWWFSHFFRKDCKPESDFLTAIATTCLYARDQKVTKLAHHFPASCALASVPAVTRLELDIGNERVHVFNHNGVCVWDVVSILAKKMLEVVPTAAVVVDKPPLRMYEAIAREWQQYVVLRISMYGPGSVHAHLDISEEILEDYVNTATH